MENDMATINAKTIVGKDFPPEEGARLADELLRRGTDFSDLEIELQGLPASLIISAFFNGFLQRVFEKSADLLPLAKQIQWNPKFDFQRENIGQWMKDFKPFVASKQQTA